MDFTLEGKINSLDHNKLTVHTEENIIFHVSYDDKTEFKDEDGKPAHSTDLHVGLQIRVEGDLAESGEIGSAEDYTAKSTVPKIEPQWKSCEAISANATGSGRTCSAFTETTPS